MKIQKSSNLPVSYRQLNSWQKLGIVIGDRGDNMNGWRKFSVCDRVWIEIILVCRKFGISLENIQKVKSNNCINIVEAFKGHPSKYLIIYNDFDSEIISLGFNNESTRDYIKIDITNLTRKVYYNLNIHPQFNHNTTLS